MAVAARMVGKNPSLYPNILAKMRVAAAADMPERNDNREPRLRRMPKKIGGKINGSQRFIEAKTFSRMPLKYSAETSPAIPIKTVTKRAIASCCLELS